jgi:hypothetical protein
MKCNLQKAAEADTRGGDADEVAVLLKLVTMFLFRRPKGAHTAWELEFWQQPTACWQFFLRKSVKPAAPRTIKLSVSRFSSIE